MAPLGPLLIIALYTLYNTSEQSYITSKRSNKQSSCWLCRTKFLKQ